MKVNAKSPRPGVKGMVAVLKSATPSFRIIIDRPMLKRFIYLIFLDVWKSNRHGLNKDSSTMNPSKSAGQRRASQIVRSKKQTLGGKINKIFEFENRLSFIM